MTDDVLERSAREPDEVLKYGADPLQLVEVYLPAGSSSDDVLPLVVLVHGGFWRNRYDRVHLRPLAEALASAGVRVLLPEYRRVGDPGGGWPGSVDDVRHVLRWAAGRSFAPASGPVLAGHSAGGHLVVRALVGPSAPGAPEVPVRRVVSLAGVLDLAEAHRLGLSAGAVSEFLGPGGFEFLGHADPLSQPAPSVPVVLVHGVLDDDVPLAQSIAYRETHSVELVELPHAGHYELIDPLAPEFTVIRRILLGG